MPKTLFLSLFVLACANNPNVTDSAVSDTAVLDGAVVDNGALDGAGELLDDGTSDVRPCIGCAPSQPVTLCQFRGTPFAGSAGTVEIGEATATGFQAWIEGAAVMYRWGAQGGTMITPKFRLPADFAPSNEATPCIRVEVINNGSAFTESYRMLQLAFEARREDGMITIGAIWDQLGTADFATGTPLNLTVRAWSTTARAETTLAITLREEPIRAPDGQDCTQFRIERARGGNCVTRVFEGNAMFEAIVDSPANEFRCGDTSVKVTYRFVADSHNGQADSRCFLYPEQAVTGKFTSSTTANPPRACIRASDFQGQRFRVERRETVRGTCTPAQLVPVLAGTRFEAIQTECDNLCR